MRCRLISLCGRPDITLGASACLVGRHHTCDVQIDSPLVSRRHCFLTRERNTVVVRDLGSHNGTFINDARIDSGVLRQGDSLTIASLRYRLEILGDCSDDASTAFDILGIARPSPS